MSRRNFKLRHYKSPAKRLVPLGLSGAGAKPCDRASSFVNRSQKRVA
jgi:hypothetical protein